MYEFSGSDEEQPSHGQKWQRDQPHPNTDSDTMKEKRKNLFLADPKSPDLKELDGTLKRPEGDLTPVSSIVETRLIVIRIFYFYVAKFYF